MAGHRIRQMARPPQEGAPGINLKREVRSVTRRAARGRCSSPNESGPTARLLRPQEGPGRVGQSGPEREGWWEAMGGWGAVGREDHTAGSRAFPPPPAIRLLRAASRGGRRRPLAASSAPCRPQPAALPFRSARTPDPQPITERPLALLLLAAVAGLHSLGPCAVKDFCLY